MAAQAGGRGQGLFQVDLAAALEVDEGGALEGFDADVSPEAIARQLDGSQAYAVDGNAVAQLDVTEVELAGLDVDAHVPALGRQAADGADGFDDAGEHGVFLKNGLRGASSGLYAGRRQRDGRDPPVIAHCTHFGDFQPRRFAHLRQWPIQQWASLGAKEGTGDEQLVLIDQA